MDSILTIEQENILSVLNICIEAEIKIALLLHFFRQSSTLSYFVANQDNRPKMPGKHIIGVVAELKRESK